MVDPLDGALLDLQREYLASMPERLEELRSDLAAMNGGATEAAASLKAHLHRLAGSGGSFGFLDLSAIAREAEQYLAGHPALQDTGLTPIFDRLEEAIQHAEARLVASRADKSGTVIPRALIVMRSSPQRERITQELKKAGYTVRVGSRQDDPGTIPLEELPHLVVIGGEAGDGDPSAVAAAWTGNPRRRPGAVVLVETLRGVDRLRAIAAGVDAVFPAEQVEQKLVRYARTFARIGPPPSNVLLVDHDAVLAARIVPLLEQADVKVIRCLPTQAADEVLEREVPDLLLLHTRLVGADPFALARTLRQDSRYYLLPIVFIGEDTGAARLGALRAGSDDFVPLTAEPELLVQTVVSRATRGRRLREMVYRDGLTGLLNHATLLAELDNAVDYSRRHGEPLAFLLFELDGFRKLSERLGPRAGDEVLLHIAAVFRSNVRASDVIGRFGLEAFGMLLRGASASGSAVLAEKLHRVLGEQPAHTTTSQVVPLQVKVGSAVFPRDGTTSAELTQVAAKRLSG